MRGKFTFKDGYTYRMPVTLRNYPYNRDVRVFYSDCRAYFVDQKTDMEALAALIPDTFEILAPIVNWQYVNCRGVDFLANGEYRILQASVPVRFCGKEDTLEGIYPLVILEDNATPVLGGREEDGMPKLVCNISIDRHVGDHWFASAAAECETIARMNFRESGECTPEQIAAFNVRGSVAAFGNRCLPNVDKPGLAFQEYVLYPQECHASRMFSGTGEMGIVPPAAPYILPLFNSTLCALSTLPNLGFENALRMDCTLRLCVSDSRAIR